MIGNILCFFKNPHSYVKTALATFGATFGKIALLLVQHMVTLVVADLASWLNDGCVFESHSSLGEQKEDGSRRT